MLSPVAGKKGILESLLDSVHFLLVTFAFPGCFLYVYTGLPVQQFG